MKTELPVRSAVLKHGTGGLVVRWVTTSEYPLLYVFWVSFVFAEGKCYDFDIYVSISGVANAHRRDRIPMLMIIGTPFFILVAYSK
jgi:hypothetical protein